MLLTQAFPMSISSRSGAGDTELEARIRVVGVGAGPHAKVLADALRNHDTYEAVGLVNLHPEFGLEALLGVPVVGTLDDLARLRRDGLRHCFVGLGGLATTLPGATFFSAS